MTIGHVTLQPGHLSGASYCHDQAAECEGYAEQARLPDVKALYKNLARHWLELARKAEARSRLHR
ncbi:MAG: hypothetical protein QOF56_1341 [Acidobacteriaceae bacterium]|jgi:hypothetical protein|nr:hypothetical protein [Acidobacteriaceae bacterium]